MKWTSKPQPMKRPALQPMTREPALSAKCVWFIVRCLPLALLVSLIFALSACSKTVSITPMPAPPANLASDCPTLAPLPSPFLDPERSIWELELLTAYADCATKHRMTVDAWTNAVEAID